MHCWKDMYPGAIYAILYHNLKRRWRTGGRMERVCAQRERRTRVTATARAENTGLGTALRERAAFLVLRMKKMRKHIKAPLQKCTSDGCPGDAKYARFCKDTRHERLFVCLSDETSLSDIESVSTTPNCSQIIIGPNEGRRSGT